ncbi:hypothetical protein KKG90_12655 [Candidatus Bipolaricaulota bacterium]|nr:hypothetical protein [Candidatus Bipolaricaulota bacterium]
MTPKNHKNPEEKLAAAKTEKLSYEAPQAVFVPLKLEERLLACLKSFGGCPPGPDNLS